MREAAVAILLLASCGSAEKMNETPLLITQRDQVEAAVGKRVTLRGEFVSSKIQTILGVDVDGDHLSRDVKTATATGVLQKTVVTQDDIDKEVKRLGGVFPTRGPGTFYILIDPASNTAAKAEVLK
ncbi:MAG TPA: hypothetical protein VE981_21145 [Planctomycetota bacterium]|nr:hypothetical protein [Planctomycetota bacterium]